MPLSAAPAAWAAAVVSARSAGMLALAAELPAGPTVGTTANTTVRASVLTKLARAPSTCATAGGRAASAAGFSGQPSVWCRAAISVAVRVTPVGPLGSRGPMTLRKPVDAARLFWAVTSSAGSAKTGWEKCMTTSVEVIVPAEGKCLLRTAWPVAESLPAGPETALPNPAVVVPTEPRARAANIPIPAIAVTTGLRTKAVATRPQKPTCGVERTVRLLGQKTARPRIASSAGSSVRPARSIRAMPMASAGPSPW